ncbi:MAG: hypothetical protein KAV87_61975 [Desulfobacteraceae bacterium]|nr:hypothetical protein [Desulfobacteraceae bacterium]
MNEHRKFWVTTIIAIAALLISVVSTIFNEIRYAKNEQEAVYVTIKKFFGEYPISTTDDYSGIKGNGLINTIWEVILSNTGKSTVSIVEYDLWTVHQDGMVQYSGFNQGLFNPDLTKADLPINIEPGTSIKLFLKTGLSVGLKASKLISAAPPEAKSRIMVLSKYLAGEGMIDIFDNPVTPFWDEKKTKVTGFRVDSQENDQVILISFRTARNNSYLDDSRWYEFQT